MKYLKHFKSLSEAKAQGKSGLDSPHIDIIDSFNVSNIYKDTNDVFKCDFTNEGRLFVPEVINYVSFSAQQEQTVALSIDGSIVPTLLYSFNKKDWNSWNYSALTFGTEARPVVYIKGVNNSMFSTESGKHKFVFSNASAKVYVGGNVMCLLDGDNPSSAVTIDACFASLFYGCEAIQTVAENFLPATSVCYYAYNQMFYGCTALTSAPALPAMTLGEACYCDMFDSCDSLAAAPALPATELSERCYAYMFTFCGSLTESPVLPASALSQYCYNCMFEECSSLNKVTCYAIDRSGTGSTSGWLNGVSEFGDFYGKSEALWYPGSSEGYPIGWTFNEI